VKTQLDWLSHIAALRNAAPTNGVLFFDPSNDGSMLSMTDNGGALAIAKAPEITVGEPKAISYSLLARAWSDGAQLWFQDKYVRLSRPDGVVDLTYHQHEPIITPPPKLAWRGADSLRNGLEFVMPVTKGERAPMDLYTSVKIQGDLVIGTTGVVTRIFTMPDVLGQASIPNLYAPVIRNMLRLCETPEVAITEGKTYIRGDGMYAQFANSNHMPIPWQKLMDDLAQYPESVYEIDITALYDWLDVIALTSMPNTHLEFGDDALRLHDFHDTISATVPARRLYGEKPTYIVTVSSVYFPRNIRGNTPEDEWTSNKVVQMHVWDKMKPVMLAEPEQPEQLIAIMVMGDPKQHKKVTAN
jgi:hypothetical protein